MDEHLLDRMGSVFQDIEQLKSRRTIKVSDSSQVKMFTVLMHNDPETRRHGVPLLPAETEGQTSPALLRSFLFRTKKHLPALCSAIQ